MYYKSKRASDEPLRVAIREKAMERRRFGGRRIIVLLRRDDFTDNHKRIWRVYREEGLQVRKRKRKRKERIRRLPLEAPNCPNERWSMDFMHDTTTCGRSIRILNIVDDYTRECLWSEVDTSLSGHRVCRILNNLIDMRGKPKSILTDNGPEFTGLALDQWAYNHKVELRFIQPGKPSQNAYVESFNGSMRDECLNEHYFLNINHARDLIEQWRIDYNEVRPLSSLNQDTPAQFASRASPLGGSDNYSLIQQNNNNN